MLTELLTALLDGPDARKRAELLSRASLRGQGLRTLRPAFWRALAPLSDSEIKRIASALALRPHLDATPLSTAITEPALAVGLLPNLAHAPQENLWSIPVDIGLHPLGTIHIARGGPASCATDIASVIAPALSASAMGFFLLHNHPSGDPTPSARDFAFTARVAKGCRALNIHFHDHLVIAGSRWRSCMAHSRPTIRAMPAGASRSLSE